MQSVMLLGMAVALLPALLLFFLDDDRSLGPESDSLRKILQSHKRRRIKVDPATGQQQSREGGAAAGGRSPHQGGSAPLFRPLLQREERGERHVYLVVRGT